MMRWLAPLVLLLPTVACEYIPRALEDQVDWDTLPGAGDLAVKGKFKMFAGYINIDEDHGKHIFYWFMEAQDKPDDAPVVLWTNGGPGCSGLLGLLTEHGPFQVRDEGKTLVDNEYSWNKLANMLYVEIPSGVGYSYSDTPEDYKVTGDAKTAADNYALIQGWFNRFPQYRSNLFYISSESYGGHYMPQLALEIVTRNEESREARGRGARGGADMATVNFGGFLVGNPYTEASSNQVGMYQAYWGKQLVPKPVFDLYMSRCVDGGYSGHLEECQDLEAQMDQFIGHVNPYALDFPVCPGDFAGSGRTVPRAQAMHLRAQVAHSLHKAQGVTEVKAMQRSRKLKDEGEEEEEGAKSVLEVGSAAYEPCAEDYTIPYLNREDVRVALHTRARGGDRNTPRVRGGNIPLAAWGGEHDYPWEQCSSRVNYNQQDLLPPQMPYYNKLLDGHYGLKILVFSGDDDAVCATWGTQWWIYNLGYDTLEGSFWEPWESDGQVAGYVTRFEGADLTFVTVHSAGHEVPAYQPQRALDMFKRFLDGSWFLS